MRIVDVLAGSIHHKHQLAVFRRRKRPRDHQIIDDAAGVTLAAASTLDKELRANLAKGTDKAAAEAVGKAVAPRAAQAGVKDVVFDRGGYLYPGRVTALADGAREGGLNF